jgi:maltose phosphorylase (EC 2.4.1.8)
MERLFAIDPWKVKTDRMSKEHRRFQESITSLGNGYMGMRGNFEEGYSGDHLKGTYVAGIWFPDKTRVGWWKVGYPLYFGKVINNVDIIQMEIYLDGEKVDLFRDRIIDFEMELDMQKGILRRRVIIDKGKRYRLDFERFLSLEIKELCAIRISVECVSGPAEVKIISSLDGDVRNEDANYDEKFWLPVHAGKNCLIVETKPNPFGVEQFTVATFMENRPKGLKAEGVEIHELEVSETYTGKLEKGEKASLEKRVIVTTSRDYEKNQLGEACERILHTLSERTYESLRSVHEQLWKKRWEKADVEIGGDPAAQQGIRFNLFQLFCTYYGEDSRLNVGPKGFTGEKYGGATYWDTEAFIIPFYLAVADPSVAKNLLLYRYHQLPGAKENARRLGLKGALYPMVTFTGVECHNEWEITFEEIHRNGAIAHAIYNYTNYTGDESYLTEKGIEVLVEICRFWADRVHYHSGKGKYMIHGVTGPNEYENNVNNNWYTNYIAAWTLEYTLSALDKITAKKREELGVTAEETKRWADISKNMYLPYDEERKIFVQHDTFLDKELKTVADLNPEDLPLNQHWSWDRILRSCYIKQADVLQGIYFFGDRFSMEEKRRNFEFYEPMTVHESSLSPSVHAILAAELRKKEKAVELYERTARLDLDNYNNDTADGLHITSMSGSWLAIVQGFAGMRTYGGHLSFAPIIPDQWNYYRFHVNYRGRLLYIHVEKEQATFHLVSGDPLEITVYGDKYTLSDNISVPLQA